MVLETCHRVELITVEEGPIERGPTGSATTRGRNAVRRVFEVVAGFDSAVVAEEQLLGQVRIAYERALAHGDTGPILNELLRRAMRFGRRVRASARPGTDRSLADPALSWLSERLRSRAAIVVVGTGEMARLMAERLARARHRLTIVSRDAARGRRAILGLPKSTTRLHLGVPTPDLLSGVDAVVVAARSREPLVRGRDLGDARPWTVDLSTPSAIDAEGISALGDRLLDIDRVGRMADGAPVLAPRMERRLRAEVDEEVHGFVLWLDERRAADAVSLLHRDAAEIRRRHLARLRQRASLNAEQLTAVEAATNAMIGELLHGPTVQLRRGVADAAVIRRLFGVDA